MDLENNKNIEQNPNNEQKSNDAKQEKQNIEIPESIKKLSFEEALNQLEDIISKFESGEISLDSSIKFYKKGTALKKHCQNKLNEAKLVVEQIDINDKGEIKLKPFDADDRI